MEPFYDRNITPRGKKYSVVTPLGKLIHFGDVRYKQFKDKIGRYSRMDHLDENRRARYLSRAMGIRDRNGLTWNNPESANYYAIRYLW